MLTFYLFDNDLVFRGAIRGYGGYYAGGFIHRDGVYIQSKTNLFAFLDLTLKEFEHKIDKLIHASKEGKIVTLQIEIEFPSSCQG